ncbi:MAG: hypothetical protein Q8R40_01120 [bacterium]|nr:hypothetical protein [bacterium]
MDKLEKVEKELYEKEKEAQEDLERRSKWRVFYPRTSQKVPSTWVGQRPSDPGPQPSIMRHPWRYVGGGIVLLLIALTGVFVFLYLRTQGQEARIEIQASDTTESGGIITIPVVFRNVSHTTLGEGEIVITLPEGALLREDGRDIEAPVRISKKVADLKPDEQGVVEISARLFGKENEDQLITAVYVYRPESLRARFSAKATKEIMISKVPLALSWEVPETLSRGQEVNLKVHYVLSSRLAFEKMALRMEYPNGFTFISSEPKPSFGDTVWELGTLEPEREGIIVIHGKIAGEEGEIKAFRSGLGSFNALTKEWKVFSESSRDIQIAVTPLAIQASLEGQREGIVKPGSLLNFSLTYRNNTSSTLKNVTIKAFFEGSVLNRSMISPGEGGVVDFESGAAVWGPGNVKKLREIGPNESGEVKVSVRTKDPPPVLTDKDKNLVVGLRALIDAASIPDELQGTTLSSQDRIEFKVSSKVVFSGKVLYRDSPIPNTGPLPPKVGEKTSYTIVWEVKNFTNILENTDIVATLPPNVKWENVVRSEGMQIMYDAPSGQVRWHMGSVAAGTGVLKPTLTGAFQVSITPAEVDRSTAVRLVNESFLSATDMFTNESVEQKINDMSTELRFDPSTSISDWTVY